MSSPDEALSLVGKDGAKAEFATPSFFQRNGAVLRLLHLSFAFLLVFASFK